MQHLSFVTRQIKNHFDDYLHSISKLKLDKTWGYLETKAMNSWQNTSDTLTNISFYKDAFAQNIDYVAEFGGIVLHHYYHYYYHYFGTNFLGCNWIIRKGITNYIHTELWM